jgi:hypothetical protein
VNPAERFFMRGEVVVTQYAPFVEIGLGRLRMRRMVAYAKSDDSRALSWY